MCSVKIEYIPTFAPPSFKTSNGHSKASDGQAGVAQRWSELWVRDPKCKAGA